MRVYPELSLSVHLPTVTAIGIWNEGFTNTVGHMGIYRGTYQWMREKLGVRVNRIPRPLWFEHILMMHGVRYPDPKDEVKLCQLSPRLMQGHRIRSK